HRGLESDPLDVQRTGFMMQRFLHVGAAALVAVVSLFSATTSNAEINPAPIAVPATGTSGMAPMYPSAITVKAPQGALYRGGISVQLIGVTHPCPRELALL